MAVLFWPPLTVDPPPNTAPTVTISAPGNGAVVTAGDNVSFAGGASDTEDGSLTSSLSWVSSVDGAIGSGRSASGRLAETSASGDGRRAVWRYGLEAWLDRPVRGSQLHGHRYPDAGYRSACDVHVRHWRFRLPAYRGFCPWHQQRTICAQFQLLLANRFSFY